MLALSVASAIGPLGCFATATAVPFDDCAYVHTDVHTSSPDLVVYGDADGDGRLDVVAKTQDEIFGLFKQTSARSFSTPVSLEGVLAASTTLCEGQNRGGSGGVDFDGDGHPDLVVLGVATTWGGSRGIADRVYFGTDATATIGTLSDATVMSGAETRNSNRCAIADFDGDGLPDLTVVNIFFGEADVAYLYEGSRSFSSAKALATSGFGHDIFAADIDLDGNMDVIVMQSDGKGENVLYGQGDGTFTDAYRFSGGSTGAGCACDFDGDGYPDVATGDFHASNGVRLFMNKGAAATDRSQQFMSSVTLTNALQHVYGMACGDIDGDGDADLVVTQSSGSAYYFANDGDGNFADGIEIATLHQASQIALVDVDGDCKLDLVGAGMICYGATAVTAAEADACGGVVTCDASGAIANGEPAGCGRDLKAGSSCAPVCDAGFELTGSRSCDASGTLSDTAKCAPTSPYEDLKDCCGSKLKHWFDFSESSIDGDIELSTISSFVDKVENAANLAVYGKVKYKIGVQNGLNAIFIDTDLTGPHS